MFRQSQKIERRHHSRRLLLDPPVTVSWGDSHSELLFDIGPGGISVYGILPWKRNELFPLSFDLPGEASSIKTNVRLAWTHTSRRRSGISFVDLDNTLLALLQNWLLVPYFTACSDKSPKPEAQETIPA